MAIGASQSVDSIGLGWDLMYQVMLLCTQTFLFLFLCQNTEHEGGGRWREKLSTVWKQLRKVFNDLGMSQVINVLGNEIGHSYKICDDIELKGLKIL